MAERTSVERITFCGWEGDVIQAGMTLELTPDQSVTLARLGWSLFPEAGGKQALSVALAALCVAIDQPGPFIEVVRKGIMAGHSLRQNKGEPGSFGIAPPTS